MSFKENATFKRTKLKLVAGTLEVAENKFIFRKESKKAWITVAIPGLIFGITGNLLERGLIGLIIGSFLGVTIGYFVLKKLKEKNPSFQASETIAEFNIDSIEKIELKKHGANYLHTFSTSKGEFAFYFKKENVLTEYKKIIQETCGKNVELSENMLTVKD